MKNEPSSPNTLLNAARSLLELAPPALAARGAAMQAALQPLALHPDIEAAALLAPALEAGALERDQARSAIGAEPAGLAEGAANLPRPGVELLLTADHPDPAAQTENIRQMLLAMVQDIRTIIIRLADVLVELRELKNAPEQERRDAARLVLAVYAPLANRLGIWQLKWELEDLAFRYAEPETYKRIAAALNEKRISREGYIRAVIAELENLLANNGIKADVKGRPKHIYSIWKKMQKKQLDLDELYDLRAVRVLVDSVKDCYAALGVVHGRWRHIPKEFDDYIATPKGNHYQSLHTAVFGPEHRPLEVQIRTFDMHRHAELGVAAHWRYKEGGGRDFALEEKVAWMRQLLEAEGGNDFLDRFQSEIFQDRIYVLTPRGAVIDLPANATPVDFAYHVHTEIGHRCRGAKVNGRIVPLTHTLKTGDRVEILTAKTGEPSRDWLNPQAGYVASGRARDKIRYWFRQQSHEVNLEKGRAMLEKELERLGIQSSADAIAKRLKLASADAVHIALGAGDISIRQITNALERMHGLADSALPATARAARPSRKTPGFSVSGVDDLLTHPARCCQPLPPDAIRGYITRGRGVTIHKRECPHLARLQAREPNRVVDVDWGEAASGRHAVEVHVEAMDRHGLLRDVAALMTDEKINILALNTRRTEEAGTIVIQLELEIRDVEQLSRVINRLNGLAGVYQARRHLPL